MKFRHAIIAAVAAAALSGSSALMAAEFVVPSHYTLELVDGETDNFDYNRSNRTLNLGPGRHQLALIFEGNFGTSETLRLVRATNPVIIEIPNMPADATYTFKYPRPMGRDKAEQYARNQQITLTDGSGRELSENEAYYYLLTAESGFTMMRDFRQELLSLNRLYSPRYVQGSNRTIGMTSYGAPVITADSTAALRGNVQTAGAGAFSGTMPAPATSSAQHSNMATSSTLGGSVPAPTAPSAVLNQLINLYESADSDTKLQFVKYVMSH